jgi:hypothetical protein
MSLFGPRSDPVREMYDPERADFNLRFLLRQFFFSSLSPSSLWDGSGVFIGRAAISNKPNELLTN